MELSGEHHFASPREAVWAVLMDPAALRVAIPGCEELTETGPDAYDMTVKVGLGAVRLSLSGNGAMTDPHPHERYTLSGAGSGRGGGVRGQALIELHPEGDGTMLTYSGDVHARGAVARVGSRMIRSTANLMIKRFFGAMDDQLAGPAANGG